MKALQYVKRQFVLRDTRDIHRLIVHLLTHWELPRVEFQVDDLHVLHSQRAQHRFARLSARCNCLIGESLGAMTMVGGLIMAWASNRGWRDMALVVAATLSAWLVGRGIELALTRWRLLWVLRRLRRRLAGKDLDEVVSVPASEGMKPIRIEELRVAEEAAAQDNRTQHPRRNGPGRPKVMVRSIADINRLIPRLAIRWTVPRIEISVNTLPMLDVQRAQTRIVRLSNGCTYMLAAVLAVVVLLGGLFFKIWTESQSWLFSEREDWWQLGLDGHDVTPVLIAALCAGLIGAAIEWVSMRVRLLLVLRRLRNQLV